MKVATGQDTTSPAMPNSTWVAPAAAAGGDSWIKIAAASATTSAEGRMLLMASLLGWFPSGIGLRRLPLPEPGRGWGYTRAFSRAARRRPIWFQWQRARSKMTLARLGSGSIVCRSTGPVKCMTSLKEVPAPTPLFTVRLKMNVPLAR